VGVGDWHWPGRAGRAGGSSDPRRRLMSYEGSQRGRDHQRDIMARATVGLFAELGRALGLLTVSEATV
jgi:hypothetical protein